MLEPMPDQMETRSQTDHGKWPNPLVNGSPESASSASPRRTAPWILRNEKFVRAMSMVGLYVFGGIFLVSILAVGAFALISVAIATLFLASLAIFLVLWILSRRRR